MIHLLRRIDRIHRMGVEAGGGRRQGSEDETDTGSNWGAHAYGRGKGDTERFSQ